MGYTYKRRWLPEVRQMLEDRRGDWPKISRDTGVNYRTLQSIAQGRVRGPSVETVERLHQYLST